jgi:recombination protein U
MALPTQITIPDETVHERFLLRAAAGRRSRQLGDIFEQWILRGCDWYWDKEIAYIEKTPEPMRPIKVYGDRRKGQFIAIYTKQAQPDFKGTLYDGSTIIFDAKSTSQDILQQSAVTDEQRKEFDRYEKMGARCYIMAMLDFTDFYRIPWGDWKAAPEKLGRKHFKRGDLEPYRIQCRNGVILFLEGIEL